MNDKNGREIMAGDLLKVFHYQDCGTRKLIYMYKLVVKTESIKRLVDVVSLGRFGLGAHSCDMRVLVGEDVEIIDGPTINDVAWYERQKRKEKCDS